MILKLEIQLFEEPMTKMLLEFLIKKYGTDYFYVINILDEELFDGYLFAGIEPSNKLHIFTIAIREKARNNGWGKRLMNFIIEKAKNNGVSEITLEVNENNIVAYNLYTGLGFVKCGYARNYYSKGQHALVMRLSI